MKKNVFAFALALLTATSAWAYDFKAGDLYYNITDEAAKTVEVTYEDYWDSNNYSSLPGAVTIPETVSYNSTTYSVTSIGDYAFYQCSALTQVAIPKSVTSIGNGAFYQCSALTQVTIPDGVTNIGSAAFYYCSALTAINVESGNTAYCSENGILFNKDKTTLIQYPASKTGTTYAIPSSVTSIESSAFWSCDALMQVEIPNSVTDFGDNAFYGCSALTQVNIPSSVTSIGSSAFASCTALTQVNIPSSVTSIEYSAFQNCTALTQVNIPSSVTSIEYSAFQNCTALTAINVESGNTAYCSENGILFNKDKTTLITYPAGKPETTYNIPNSVTSIGNSAFTSCSTLKQVSIPSSVTSIRNSAFSGCTALTQVTIPSSVTSIGNMAFYYCTALKQVNIPSSVTSIGDMAFSYCFALKQVNIGNSVTSIGNSTFSGCSALAEMTILATVPPTVGGYAFDGVNREIPVSVPAESLKDYQAAVVWKEFTNLHAMPTGTLHNPQQLPVSLYDMQGRMVYSGTAATVSQPAGVYVLRCAGASSKVLF